MAGADRMTIEEVVKRVLLDEHAVVIREAVKAVAAEMMELEVSELISALSAVSAGPRIARRIAMAIASGAGTSAVTTRSFRVATPLGSRVAGFLVEATRAHEDRWDAVAATATGGPLPPGLSFSSRGVKPDRGGHL